MNNVNLRMAHPLVSIIIPCYNAEKYVAEAIQSALDQTYPNCEIIVIDDGSTDRSLEVIKSFGNKIRWETGPNRGGCAARNRGIELARGEWIQFLDADDALISTCIERKVAVPFKRGTTIICNLRMMDNDNNESLTRFWTNDAYDLEYMLSNGSPQTAAPLHRRDDLIAIRGFRNELPCAQEYDLHLRLAIICGITFQSNNDIGVAIRPVSKSLSRSAGAKLCFANIAVLKHALELLEKKGEISSVLKTSIARNYTNIARTLWRAGIRREAVALVTEAKKMSRKWFVGNYRKRTAELLVRLIGFRLYELMHSLSRG